MRVSDKSTISMALMGCSGAVESISGTWDALLFLFAEWRLWLFHSALICLFWKRLGL